MPVNEISAILKFLIGIVSEQISALHYKDTEEERGESVGMSHSKRLNTVLVVSRLGTWCGSSASCLSAANRLRIRLYSRNPQN